MSKMSAFGVGLLLFGSAIGTGSAAVIYDGGAPDLGGVYYGERSTGIITDVASQFQLQAGLNTVSDVHWWGGCVQGPTCPAGDFIVSFYSDNGGLPGALIQSFSVGNANQTATGNAIGSLYTEYSYSAFVGPLAFTPLTTFWLGLSNDTGGQAGNWGQETTSNANVPQTHAQYAAIDLGPPFVVGWNTLPSPLAFSLTNDAAAVPEPATLALLGVGVAGLAAMRRRKLR